MYVYRVSLKSYQRKFPMHKATTGQQGFNPQCYIHYYMHLYMYFIYIEALLDMHMDSLVFFHI